MGGGGGLSHGSITGLVKSVLFVLKTRPLSQPALATAVCECVCLCVCVCVCVVTSRYVTQHAGSLCPRFSCAQSLHHARHEAVFGPSGRHVI